ncbi:hypothetical protein F6H99_08915 [Streptococcus anginosus]|nr:hypothetical protein F6I32_08845 [Streptococcus anginosus]KAA9254920.1 hypothetical protein F6I28_03575 [Streptococcus anginosus]KAA9258719.1 hypothetical protein F6I23_10235 [Streptococcus anginosus]KAA9260840.1 hypothetical protein F6I22_09495 [Streptococcus anginosus]KAA9308522.1 hypothetical protein F6H99_08915 [Streptococcus anginosus]
MIAQSTALRWQIKLAKQVSKLFAFQARKSTFDENFVFFIYNLKQLDNCLSTLAGVGVRTKNFQFLVRTPIIFKSILSQSSESWLRH